MGSSASVENKARISKSSPQNLDVRRVYSQQNEEEQVLENAIMSHPETNGNSDNSEKVNTDEIKSRKKDIDEYTFTQEKDVVEQSLGNVNVAKIDEKPKSNELTDEIKTKIDNAFEQLGEAIDRIKPIQTVTDFRAENGYWKADLTKSLSQFAITFDIIGNIDTLSYDVIQQYQNELGQRLSMSKSTSVICKIIMDIWQKGYKSDDGQVLFDHVVISIALNILHNFSDCSREVTFDIANEPKFLETIKKILTKLFVAYMQKETQAADVHVMKSCLLICDNVSKVDQNITRLRSLEIVYILCFFLHAKEDVYRFFALSCLANIIDEKQSAILQDKRDVVAFLLTTLSLAIKSPNHHCSHESISISAQECALTVRRLARNDANKILLVDLGCLPYLAELARIGNGAEQREAVGALRVLAFEERNREKIVNDKELLIIDLLVELKGKTEDEEVRKAVEGTLWVLRETLQRNEKYKHIVAQLGGIPAAPVPGKTGHIMISYNWSHQEVLIKIKHYLVKQGYKVWMDIENMSGSTLQSMAEAVEGASIVLICISQAYKDSSNCRDEAEYARQKKKNIIPLKMERGYEPDGWLGVIVGSKLFYEFSGKYPFEPKLKELYHAIAKSYGKDKLETTLAPYRIYHGEPMDDVSRWTPEQVNKWIEKHNLPKKSFAKLTGKLLSLLVMMRSEAPEVFYNNLQKNLGITNLHILADFLSALNDLNI